MRESFFIHPSSFMIIGEVPEWTIGALSKSVVALRSPWVRIPPSPLVKDTQKQGVFFCRFSRFFILFNTFISDNPY